MDALQAFFTRATDLLAGVNALSVAVRLALAIVLSGLIGLERESKHRAAGFRTHILVCTASALVMLTNLYIVEKLTPGASDPVRMGAQVISGIGFLGAGTIMVTGRNQQVRGLTTAAGLWASACIGLAVGSGFYLGAIAATVLVYVIMAFLTVINRRFYTPIKSLNLYVELGDLSAMRDVIHKCRETGYRIASMDMSKGKPTKNRSTAVVMVLESEGAPDDNAAFLYDIEQTEGVLFAAALDASA